MTLKQWFKKTGLSIKSVAAQLGIHPVSLGRIANGRSSPGRELAMEIQKFTKNIVMAEDLFIAVKEKPKCPHCGRKMYN